SVVGLHAELFETFDWRGDDRSRGSHKTRVISAGTFHIAGGIATVDHESVLVSAHTSNAAAAGVSFAVSRSRSAVETWFGHRLQKHQRSGVATQAGHIGEDIGIEHVADAGVQSLQLDAGAGSYFDGFGELPKLQRDVKRG